MQPPMVVFQDFQRLGNRFAVLFHHLENCPPIVLQNHPTPRALHEEVTRRVASNRGIYVFYEGDDARYVGISDNISSRLHSHRARLRRDGRSPATFARILAKHEFRHRYGVEHGLFSLALTREFNADPAHINLLERAIEQVSGMDVRVVKVQHPHEQTTFEIYVHERLRTPFNSFATH